MILASPCRHFVCRPAEVVTELKATVAEMESKAYDQLASLFGEEIASNFEEENAERIEKERLEKEREEHEKQQQQQQQEEEKEEKEEEGEEKEKTEAMEDGEIVEEEVKKASGTGAAAVDKINNNEAGEEGEEKEGKKIDEAEVKVVVAKESLNNLDSSPTADSLSYRKICTARRKIKNWPFVLDEFQRRALAAIDSGESVLVAAHTSAGKTVVAEYAVALALHNNQRVIYTTPIKALSNQKYLELRHSFESTSATTVGLVTGDVSINKDANLVVMTTEILRSMLYHRAGEVADVGWIIFDEIHYLRDAERGVVWEESIVLLPEHIHSVFLSATIPNAVEFGQWIAERHGGACHVIATSQRPVPLRHYMFPSGGSGFFLVLDEKGQFYQKNFDAMIAGFSQEQANKRGRGGASDISKVISFVLEKNLDPAIVFAFSRRECEALALQLRKATKGLISPEQRQSVGEVFDAAIASLSSDDTALPQIRSMRPLLLAGIGVHHSGMLPFLREVTEMLFQEGVIRILFATETFAMGLNMPARTVVFSACHKFDGSQTRLMQSAEYVQMSGRAGRRGLDDRGTVITMVDDRLDPAATKSMVSGLPAALTSSFHLGYNMILNAIRSNDVDPEMIVKRSFFQFQLGYLGGKDADREAVEEIQRKLAQIPLPSPQVLEYVQLCEEEERIRKNMIRVCYAPPLLTPFLCPGRIVRISEGDVDWGWGIALAVNRRAKTRNSAPLTQATLKPISANINNNNNNNNNNGENDNNGNNDLFSVFFQQSDYVDKESFVLDVLLPSTLSSSDENPQPSPFASRSTPRSFPLVVPALFSSISRVSALCVEMGGIKDLRSSAEAWFALSLMRRVLQNFKEDDDVPLLHPLQDLKISSPEALSLYHEHQSLSQRVKAHAIDKILENERNQRRKRGRQSFESENNNNNNNRREIDGDTNMITTNNDDNMEESEDESTLIESVENEDGSGAVARVRAGKEMSMLLQVKLCRKRFQLLRDVKRLGSGAQEEGLAKFRVELERRKKLLCELGYLDNESLITTKGKVACEVEVADNLIPTELMFEGVFAELSPPAIAALLSCLIAEENKQEKSKRCAVSLKEEIEKLKDAKRAVRAVEVRVGLRASEEEEELNTSLMDISFEWANMASFADICKMTEMFEGSIVRSFRRLCELLTQLARGAEAVGDETLQAKFEAALGAMHRGIVFASSLYA